MAQHDLPRHPVMRSFKRGDSWRSATWTAASLARGGPPQPQHVVHRVEALVDADITAGRRVLVAKDNADLALRSTETQLDQRPRGLTAETRGLCTSFS
jgi:hypothetical protein